jgi:hypothetical protein
MGALISGSQEPKELVLTRSYGYQNKKTLKEVVKEPQVP